jgi:hypothetical protein
MTRPKRTQMQRPPDPRRAALEKENAELRRNLAALHLKLERLSAGAAGATAALEEKAAQQIEHLIAERDQLTADYQSLLDQVVQARQNVQGLYQRRLTEYAETLAKAKQLDHAIGQSRPVANILFWIGTLVAHEAHQDHAFFSGQIETLLLNTLPQGISAHTRRAMVQSLWQHHPDVYTASALADIVYMERMGSRLLIGAALMDIAIDVQLDIGILLDTILMACERGRDPDLRAITYLCQYWPEVPAKRPATLYRALKETQQRLNHGHLTVEEFLDQRQTGAIPGGPLPKTTLDEYQAIRRKLEHARDDLLTDWKSVFSAPDEA